MIMPPEQINQVSVLDNKFKVHLKVYVVCVCIFKEVKLERGERKEKHVC